MYNRKDYSVLGSTCTSVQLPSTQALDPTDQWLLRKASTSLVSSNLNPVTCQCTTIIKSDSRADSGHRGEQEL